MKIGLQKILLFLAVVTVMGHSILPHFDHNAPPVTTQQLHQHDEQHSGKHHHEDDNDNDRQHHLFSFAQLDENFVPVNGCTPNFEIPVEYLAAFILTYNVANNLVNTKTHFGFYKEFPPPGNLLFNLPSRAPPASSVS